MILSPLNFSRQRVSANRRICTISPLGSLALLSPPPSVYLCAFCHRSFPIDFLFEKRSRGAFVYLRVCCLRDTQRVLTALTRWARGLWLSFLSFGPPTFFAKSVSSNAASEPSPFLPPPYIFFASPNGDINRLAALFPASTGKRRTSEVRRPDRPVLLIMPVMHWSAMTEGGKKLRREMKATRNLGLFLCIFCSCPIFLPRVPIASVKILLHHGVRSITVLPPLRLLETQQRSSFR